MIALAPLPSLPLGPAELHPAGSLLDAQLEAQLRSYRRRVLSGVFTVSPGEVPSFLPPGALFATPLPGGSPWLLVLDGDQAMLASPAGQVIDGEMPLLDEARRALPRAAGRTVIAGELVADGQPLSALLGAGAKADVSRLSFVGLDLLAGGDSRARMPLGGFDDRMATAHRLLDGGKHVHVARIDHVASPDAVASLYRDVVDGHRARGLLLRSPEERLLKVMPTVSLFASVVGFTERPGGAAGALLLALRRPDGHYQLVDLCTHLGDQAARLELGAQLAPLTVASAYRHPGAHGELVRFVRPGVSVEVRANDAVADDASGRPVTSLALAFDGTSWHPVRPAPSVHLVAPRVLRVLPAHEAARALMGLAQLADRCWIDGLDTVLQPPQLTPSQVVRREVWVKETKGVKAVRKLLAWKTNKEVADPDYPPYVLHWTDYSPGRREPLEREVHPAPTEASVQAMADRLLAEHIKKGWQRLA